MIRKTTPIFSPPGASAAFLACAALLTAALAPRPVRCAESPVGTTAGSTQPDLSSTPEIRAREIYVPYDEWRKLVRQQPEGIVMPLAEYRRLTLKAIAEDLKPEDVKLPAPSAVLGEVIYSGEVVEDVARLEARFSVYVTGDRWAACPLGKGLPKIAWTLDKSPAWIVSTPAGAFLLVKGPGRHDGRLQTALPLHRAESRTAISTPLPVAAASSLDITVPGRIEPENTACPTRVEYDEERDLSLVEVALGRSDRLTLSWKRGKAREGEEPVLVAVQGLVFHPERAGGRFTWRAAVLAQRKPAGDIVIAEPPGGRFAALSGPRVHTWTRDAASGRITVFLKEPATGVIELSGMGFFEGVGGELSVRCPSVAGALADVRFLGLSEPRDLRAKAITPQGFEEVPGWEKTLWSMSGLLRLPGGNASGATAERSVPSLPGDFFSNATRIFHAIGPDASITLRFEPLRARFESQSAATITVTEREVRLGCAMKITPLEGRLYRLELRVPPPWRVDSIRPAPGSARSFTAEKDSVDPGLWRLSLEKAVTGESPVEALLSARLAGDENGTVAGTLPSEFKASVPGFPRADRSSTLLGVIVHPSVTARFSDTGDWRSVSPKVLKAAGIRTENLRASLASDAPVPRLAMELGYRKPRGEYTAVTHLLVSEREYRAGCDLRIAVVDRAVDSLNLLLPEKASEPVSITGPGVKEILSPAPGVKLVRYHEPWVGVRVLRVEFSAPLEAGSPEPVPAIVLKGDFDSNRWVVFQAGGSVELRVSPGPGLAVAAPEEIPAFAVPFQAGRSLFSYSCRPTGETGMFTARVFERSEILGSLVRDKMELTTVLDTTGVSRTRARLPLSYSRDQALRLRLPTGARLLFLTVGGKQVEPIAEPGGNLLSVPLPARTYAQVELLYEKDAGRLGATGAWKEAAPVPENLPVRRSEWKLYLPPEYRADIKGNLRPDHPRQPHYFLLTFWKNIFTGKRIRWTAWAKPEPVTEEVPEFRDVRPAVRRESKQQQNLLSPREARKTTEVGLVLGDKLVPEGSTYAAGKLGGDAVLEISYREVKFSVFAARCSFLAAVLAAAALAMRRRWKALLWFLGIGLAAGTLIPPAIKWESPMLAVPFCEGLAFSTAIALIAGLGVLIVKLGRWRKKKKAGSTGPEIISAVSSVITPILFSVAALTALFSAPRNVPAAENILIPYDPESTLPPDNSTTNLKAFVPKSFFEELVSRAYPEPEPEKDLPMVPTGLYFIHVQTRYSSKKIASTRSRKVVPSHYRPVLIAAGSTNYTLTLDGDHYRLEGGFELSTFDPEGWSEFPMDFLTGRAEEVLVDGQPARVARVGTQAAKLLFKGAGRHRVAVKVTGPVDSFPGRIKVSLKLPGGDTASLLLAPPAELELDTRSLEFPAWSLDSSSVPTANSAVDRKWKTVAPGNREFTLTFHAPEVEERGSAQVSTINYTHLAAGTDIIKVIHLEKVTIAGQPQELLTFRVLGDWEITSATASGLDGWTVVEREGHRLLRTWFRKPSSEVELQVSGWLPVSTDKMPLPGLMLPGALREEGFVGLENGRLLKFSPGEPKDLRRASPRAVRLEIPSASVFRPDRVYQLYKPPADKQALLERREENINVETRAVVVLRPDRMLLAARSEYLSGGKSVTSHSVRLPAGWRFLSVTGPDLRGWEEKRLEAAGAEKAGGVLMIAEFRRPPSKGSELTWTAQRVLPESLPDPSTVEVPDIHAVSDAGAALSGLKETVEWLVAADESLAPARSDKCSYPSIPLKRAVRWLELEPSDDYRLAFRSSQRDVRLVLDVSYRKPVGECTETHFIRATPDFIQVNLRLAYSIRNGGRRLFTVNLPRGAQFVALSAAGLESREIKAGEQGTTVTVRLHSPVRGEQVIDMVYRYSCAGSGEWTVEGVSAAGDWISRTARYVGLLRLERGMIVVSAMKGLTGLKNPESAPWLPEDLAFPTAGRVFNASEGWSLTLRRPRVEAETGPPASIELAELLTVLAYDGRVRNTARYRVRNRSRQFLELAMPEDSTLWGILVDGKPTHVSRRLNNGREVLLVPIHRLGPADLSIDVMVVYETPRIALPTAVRYFSPAAPEVIDVPVIETYWKLYVPEEYSVARTGGNVKDVIGNMITGGKLKQSISDLERLKQVAETSSYSPLRAKAVRNLQRLHKELDDNMLDIQRRYVVNDLQVRQMDDKDLRVQEEYNKAAIARAEQLNGEMGDYEKEWSSQVTGAALEEEQDNYRKMYGFLENRWRQGKQKAAERAGASRRIPPAGATKKLSDLAAALPGAILPKTMRHALPFTRPVLEMQQIPAKQEMRKAKTLGMEAMPGVEMDIPVKGILYAYRRVEGHPELTVRLRSRPASRLWLLRACLVAVAAAAGFLIFRRHFGTTDFASK